MPLQLGLCKKRAFSWTSQVLETCRRFFLAKQHFQLRKNTFPFGRSDLLRCINNHNICIWGHCTVERTALYSSSYWWPVIIEDIALVMMCGDSRRAKMMPTCHSKKPRRRRKPGQVTLDHSSQHRIQCRNPRPSQNQHRQHPIYSWQGPVFLLSCWKRTEHEAKWEFNKRFKWHPGIWLIRCRKHLNSLLCSWYAWIWYSRQVKFCANVS